MEVAVRSLEDDPVFNAGHGSVLNKAGEVEMDAMITDGSKVLAIELASNTMKSYHKMFLPW